MANKLNNRYSFGTLLVLIGTALLLRNLNVLPFEIPAYVFTWKMLLVVMGFYALIIAGKGFTGLTLTAVGSYFLIPEIMGVPVLDAVLFWPGIIILFGLFFLFARPSKRKQKKYFPELKQVNSDYMDISAIVSGHSRQISSYDFKGGKITAVMGGLEVDLTNCTLSKEKCVIELDLVMGGVQLIIPREWNIKSELTPIMGGVEDSALENPGQYIDPAATVTLTGTVIM